MALAPHPRAADAPADEAALLARTAAGDRGAFTELVGRWERRFYAVALRMLGDRGDAEDAVQRAFLRVYEKAGTYRAVWPGAGWLYRIVTNVCVDALRKRRAEAAGARAAEPATHPGPRVERLDLAAAVARLPVEARTVLVLRYAADLSYGDIARVRGVSVNTVKTQLRRATAALRRRLVEEP